MDWLQMLHTMGASRGLKGVECHDWGADEKQSIAKALLCKINNLLIDLGVNFHKRFDDFRQINKIVINEESVE